MASTNLVAVSGARERLVRPHNARRETLVLVAMVIGILGGVGMRVALLPEASPARYLQPYQQLDEVLSEEPIGTLYRTLLASVPEILMVRDREGIWPEAELLEIEAVPPFASRFMPHALRDFVWSGYDGGSWIDYLGRAPANVGGYSFILRLIDLHAGYHPHPHPGVDYDPDRTVAAQVWYFPEPDRAYPGERVIDAGWIWLLQPDDPLLLVQSGVSPATTAEPAMRPRPAAEVQD